MAAITRLNPVTNETNLSQVTYRVQFSEGVNGVDINDFSLNSSTVTGAISSVLASSSNTYDVVVNNVHGVGDLGLDVENTGTDILDKANNPFIDGFDSSDVYAITSAIDVGVTITSHVNWMSGGNMYSYIIEVVNSGPLLALNTGIHYNPPINFSEAIWECAGTGNAVCPNTSGSDVIDEIANLPSGGVLTYLVSGLVATDPEMDMISTVTITPTVGINDLNASDNNATDTDPVGIFMDGFE